jgi:hypothetical protein
MADLLELAAQIVSAHVSHNAVEAVDLPQLINNLHKALVSAGQSTSLREASLPSPSGLFDRAPCYAKRRCETATNLRRRGLIGTPILRPCAACTASGVGIICRNL